MIKKISVLLSIFNDQDKLNQSIESILNQTYTNFELLIINDGSQDNSEKICEFYLSKDQRVKYYKNNKNIGLTQIFKYSFKKCIRGTNCKAGF